MVEVHRTICAHDHAEKTLTVTIDYKFIFDCVGLGRRRLDLEPLIYFFKRGLRRFV